MVILYYLWLKRNKANKNQYWKNLLALVSEKSVYTQRFLLTSAMSAGEVLTVDVDEY